MEIPHLEPDAAINFGTYNDYLNSLSRKLTPAEEDAIIANSKRDPQVLLGLALTGSSRAPQFLREVLQRSPENPLVHYEILHRADPGFDRLASARKLVNLVPNDAELWYAAAGEGGGRGHGESFCGFAVCGGMPPSRPLRRRRHSAMDTRYMKLLAALSCVLFLATGLAEDSAKFTVGAFAFTRPAGWKSIEPTSPMRKAQLQIPGKDGGKPADITFFFFGEGNGGGVEPNVQRWLGQITGKPDANKVEPQEFDGVKVTLVSAEGTLKAAPMAGIADELPDAALLGAILEHTEGAVFVKMTGPASLVKESREKFLALVKGATGKK